MWPAGGRMAAWLLLTMLTWLGACMAVAADNTMGAGSQICVQRLVCFTVNLHNDTQQAEIAFMAPTTAGWVALGIGSSMMDADMMVAWVTGTQVVLSERYSTSHSEPTTMAMTTLSLNAPKSQMVNGTMVISFFRPLQSLTQGMKNWPSGTADYIWALGDASPNSSSVSAPLGGHGSLAGTFQMNFGEYSASSNMTDISSVQPDVQFNLLVHGALMFTAYGIVLPLGIFVARYLKRTLGPYWFPAHWLLVGVAVSGLTAGGIAYAVKATPGGEHMRTPHSIVGAVVVGLLALQIINGIVIDRLFDRKARSVPWYDQVHWWLGRALALTAMASVGMGLYDYGQIVGQSAYIYGLAVCAVWILILEIIGNCVFRRRDARAQRRLGASKGQGAAAPHDILGVGTAPKPHTPGSSPYMPAKMSATSGANSVSGGGTTTISRLAWREAERQQSQPFRALPSVSQGTYSSHGRAAAATNGRLAAPLVFPRESSHTVVEQVDEYRELAYKLIPSTLPSAAESSTVATPAQPSAAFMPPLPSGNLQSITENVSNDVAGSVNRETSMLNLEDYYEERSIR